MTQDRKFETMLEMMTLNVYEMHPTDAYSGGMILVAANSAEEARFVLETEEGNDWFDYFNFSDMTQIEGLRYSGEPRVIKKAFYIQ